ncbi:hypothetical protein [Microbulbifer thermotolerans]|uniref:Uncharacterized protein n=2 Tax=Microbulbifer thermotolerans TaxID=252514 RepID=A0AB35HXZ0_MICTH|nr:hypothetical protein [Microbulbifer thermotolerans]MCX2779950.1 hypothetical protein [Microbulbifer thermotolerans]MCX2795194.1 hypothetical protein [Microbulbifer thermotolerans]MCX2801776.1 hypothetical protein [Microbulbifer thermotolerans]MCX2805373.1 hypothetical protein [Microbulbifer thermotolerans]MCX2832673.1 hypothetical protein [Microbulbifer thermotolerans]
MLEIEWKYGTPFLKGLYFIAVRMGPEAGCYDFANWNGSSWDKSIEGEVVAFCDAGSFVRCISIKWPFEDKIKLRSESRSGISLEFEEA